MNTKSCTFKNIYVNLTESPGSPSNRQYYFTCHILTANLGYAVEATEQFNPTEFPETRHILKVVKMTDKLKWSV